MESLSKPILIIDDEPEIRNMVQLFLEEDGYESISAEDGEKGLEIFAELQPLIVVTDIRMPKLLGTEVLKRIKQFNPKTEVIVITGHGEMKLAIQALQGDASDFIQKPFGYDVLSVAVKRAHKKIIVREELAQAQLQVLQSEKMASLGQLAAGIAHEVNNPVGFVSSNLGTLKKYSQNIEKFYHELRKSFSQNGNCRKALLLLDNIVRNLKIDYILSDMSSVIDESLEGTARVKRIVQDLKDFSHIDTKKLVSFNLNEGIESTLNILRNELKHKAKLKKELGDIPPFVCFPQQINQVIMNLVMNGIQAIDHFGLITIRTFEDNNGIALQISDNGCGIPKEIINRIFDPFFTTKDVGQGTGLGLHIVYGIVSRHGGSIKIDSSQGVGTTITVNLPLTPPDYNK